VFSGRRLAGRSISKRTVGHVTTSALQVRTRQAIPGPSDLALFSNLRMLQANQLQFLTHMARTYGDVAKYRLAHLTIYQVNHPDGIAQILQGNHKNYGIEGVPGFKTLKLVFGNGLITIDGDRWLYRRRLVQPHFHHRQVATMGEQMVQSTVDLMDRWHGRRVDVEPVDMNVELSQLTLRNVVQALFSMDIKDQAEYLDALTMEIAELVSKRFANPLVPPLSVPTPNNRAFIMLRGKFNSVIYQTIAKRRAALASGEEFSDLLALLMSAKDGATGRPLTDEDLRDEIATFASAGSGTATQALTWSFYLLSAHPDAEARVRAEMAEVIGDRLPTVQDLPKLTYTRAVIDEAMRLYSPVWVLTRRSLQEDTIRGYTIPAHANLLMSPYVLHRDPAYWEKPEEFNPERFLPPNDKGRHPFSYFPFGGGPRLCLGKDFALVETALVLTTMMQRFKVVLKPGHPVEPYTRAAGLHPRYGLPMTLHSL
jgi:cytochrome P450